MLVIYNYIYMVARPPNEEEGSSCVQWSIFAAGVNCQVVLRKIDFLL